MSQTREESPEPSSACCNKLENDCQSEITCEIPENHVKTATVPECAVCLQNCIHPARLPCNHVFCYLCIKGVANQSKRCPMCRQEIPAGFLEHPQLLEVSLSDKREVTVIDTEQTPQEEYQWFYEGNNGWWQYDPRTNAELETAYKQGKQTCELLIAGFLYIADFTSMFQIRRNNHSRRRRIKRDLCSAPKKGIAGLRLNDSTAVCDHRSIQQTVESHDSQSTNSSGPSLADQASSTLILENVIGDSAAGSTAAAHVEQQTISLHQVLEQMHNSSLSQ
ncbi:E3 ubiquitin-protein ligase RNF146-A-like isoform X2 [Copidosoma floridanum]|uniref:E3 ubiquitin-protein ligase RNF146-A isoform X2 n=1 Tax=Copidosoma floridanum TaxID=29053 RepID=UPI0006C9D1FD|nr:E3 ubiquitin-protein ligase RNF146-A isoform X2 [Copidosoma floridanum]XP_023245200.1 E3 ubiquitin-protein ligase RNF146-A-like isoform X2 [Copidosoma floridanum]